MSSNRELIFKLLPWQIDQQLLDYLDSKIRVGPIAISCNDENLVPLLSQEIRGKESWEILWGEKLTAGWLEERLFSTPLFPREESSWIIAAQEIPPSAWDYLDHLDVEAFKKYSKKIVLFFTKRDVRFRKLKEKTSLRGGFTLEVESPKFWQGRELLSYLARKMEINLSPQLEEYMVDRYNTQTGELRRALCLLASLQAPLSSIDIREVENLLGEGSIDRFSLAELYANKSFSHFFKMLLSRDLSYSQLRDIFAFLQTHMVKIGDSSYLQDKKKFTKYDRNILAAAKRWNKISVQKSLRIFSDLEILAKSESPKLQNRLKQMSSKMMATSSCSC